MAKISGLWSYVHLDDEAEGERIVRLAHDLVAQFELLTGESIELFLDRDALEWGDRWQDLIDEKLASVAFFIPVLTPRYFLRAECRRELQAFARSAEELGIKELVLPLLYVDVPAIHEETPSDDLIALIGTFQWEDWRDLRFTETGSEAYRRAVGKLASRLVDANAEAERVSIVQEEEEEKKAERVEAGEADEGPGLIDQLATAEATLIELPATLESLQEEIESIGTIMNAATADLSRADRQGKGFAGRLVVARRVATRLSKPTEQIYELSNRLATQLHEVDTGFRALIERAPAEIRDTPASKGPYCEFFQSVRALSSAAHEGLGSTQQMIEASAPIESSSRDLRRPLRRLRQGLTILLEAREVTDDWVRLIEETNIRCEQ